MMDHDDRDDSLDFPAPIAELSALYPERANAEWEALASGIMQAALPELQRRREGRGLVRSILRLARPVGMAAAALLLLGAIGLAVTSDADATVPAAAPSFAEVVDHEPASTLLANDRPPSANDLASVLEGDSFSQVQP
jgi:hypothetical protein